MRLLFVIETSEAAMRSIMDRDEGIDRLCRGEWVQLALIDPQTSEILWWHNGEFVPYEPSRHEIPTVESSREWYEKKRNHLGFVTILEKNVSES
jgi:hypothetical protein